MHDQRSAHARDGNGVGLTGRECRKPVAETHIDHIRHLRRLHRAPRRLKRPLIRIGGNRVRDLPLRRQSQRQMRMVGADVGETRS